MLHPPTTIARETKAAGVESTSLVACARRGPFPPERVSSVRPSPAGRADIDARVHVVARRVSAVRVIRQRVMRE
ncbi:Hypothetical protein A7982_09419 [Minicystis rosea]|nr:Hypothetical protein A7982_09419 [Minicystis rosea]